MADPAPVTVTDQILTLLLAEQRETNRLLQALVPQKPVTPKGGRKQ